MKISLVAHDLVGGGMTRASLLARACQSLGHTVEIVGLKSSDEEIYPVLPECIPLSIVSGASSLARARELVRRIDGDVIYAVKPRPTSFGAAMVARVGTNRPMIVDIDDWERGFIQEQEEASGSLLLSAYRQLRSVTQWRRWLDPNNRTYIRWLENGIRYADAVTVNSGFLHKVFGGTFVPNAKDTELFDPARFDAAACRAGLGLKDWTIIMFPGTPRPHKGLEDLLEAMNSLRRPDLKLVLVGGRSSSYMYVDYLVGKWRDLIIRLPRFPVERMPEVVAAAHVVAVPQRDTPVARAQCPMKLTDGMAMAKPILTTRVGDIPQIVRDGAWLVDPANVQQMRDALTDMLSSPDEMARKGRRARQICINHYSLRSTADALSRVIEHVR